MLYLRSRLTLPVFAAVVIGVSAGLVAWSTHAAGSTGSGRVRFLIQAVVTAPPPAAAAPVVPAAPAATETPSSVVPAPSVTVPLEGDDFLINRRTQGQAQELIPPARVPAIGGVTPGAGAGAGTNAAGARPATGAGVGVGAGPGVLTGDDAAIAAAARGRWGPGQLLLAIPKLGVTAAVAGMGYEADGRTAASPKTAWGVGWYNFTAYPGSGGNAVFAGHVDWYTGESAVFAGLGRLGGGDLVYVLLPNGGTAVYAVGGSEWVRPEAADLKNVWWGTGRDSITFITCGGTWNAAAQDYSHRLVVRAYRVR